MGGDLVVFRWVLGGSVGVVGGLGGGRTGRSVVLIIGGSRVWRVDLALFF